MVFVVTGRVAMGIPVLGREEACITLGVGYRAEICVDGIQADGRHHNAPDAFAVNAVSVL